MNRDELKGRAQELKGKAKQAIGDVTNNERLRKEGVGEEISGGAQADVGRVRRKIGETLQDVGKRIKR